jgi:hypothetical protein
VIRYRFICRGQTIAHPQNAQITASEKLCKDAWHESCSVRCPQRKPYNLPAGSAEDSGHYSNIV